MIHTLRLTPTYYEEAPKAFEWCGVAWENAFPRPFICSKDGLALGFPEQPLLVEVSPTAEPGFVEVLRFGINEADNAPGSYGGHRFEDHYEISWDAWLMAHGFTGEMDRFFVRITPEAK